MIRFDIFDALNKVERSFPDRDVSVTAKNLPFGKAVSIKVFTSNREIVQYQKAFTKKDLEELDERAMNKIWWAMVTELKASVMAEEVYGSLRDRNATTKG